MRYSQMYKQNGCELWVQSESAYLRKGGFEVPTCPNVTNNSLEVTVSLGSFLSPLRELQPGNEFVSRFGLAAPGLNINSYRIFHHKVGGQSGGLPSLHSGHPHYGSSSNSFLRADISFPV